MSRGRRRQLGAVDRMPSGRWRVRMADPVTGRRVSIGTFATKSDAETAFAKALTEQGRGAWVVPSKGRTTLNEYAHAWLESRLTRKGERLRPKTRELYEGFLRLHVLPALGEAQLHQLTTSRIRAWHTALLASGPGQSTAAKSYRPDVRLRAVPHGPRVVARSVDRRQVVSPAPHDPQHRSRGRSPGVEPMRREGGRRGAR